MDFQLVDQFSESRLFRTLDKYQKYTLKNIAELTYVYLLALEVFRLSEGHEEFAQKYAKSTIRFNNFNSFKFASNDLYHFLHILIGDDNERQLKMLKDTSHDTNVDFAHIRMFLRAIAKDKYDETFDRKYFLRLERELGIKDTNLKSIRRTILNWIGGDESKRKAAVTKLLLLVRKVIPKSEIRPELEKLARDKLDEYKIIKMDTDQTYMSSKTNYNIYKNPTGREVEQLLKKHKELRGTVAFNDNVYIWNAFDQTHMSAQIEMEEADIDKHFMYDFVFGTIDYIDDGDWEDLEKYGKYFYQSDMHGHSQNKFVGRSGLGEKNKFLVKILNYLRTIKEK